MTQNIRNLLALAGYDMSGADDDDMAGYEQVAGDELGFRFPWQKKPKKKLPPQRRLPPPLSPQQQQMANWIKRAEAGENLPGVAAARGGLERREQDIGGDIDFTFTPTSAQTVDITCDPWVIMTPVRLVVETAIVGSPGVSVKLKAVQIGPTNMLGSRSPIGIGRYAPLAPNNRVQWGNISPRIGAVLTFVTTGVPATNTSINIVVSLGAVAVG